MLWNRKNPIHEYIQTKQYLRRNRCTVLIQKSTGIDNRNNDDLIDNQHLVEVGQKVTIPLKEGKDSITSLKNRKSPGTAHIIHEMIKYGPKSLTKELLILFQKDYFLQQDTRRIDHLKQGAKTIIPSN